MESNAGIISKLLLLVLIVLSALLFWRRFAFVLRQIRTARPDPDNHWGSIARRGWTFFSEVLCQSKVIKERPLPGIAHAFVFWSFCAFAVVTLNHVATGFGVPFLARTVGSAVFTSGSHSPLPSRAPYPLPILRSAASCSGPKRWGLFRTSPV